MTSPTVAALFVSPKGPYWDRPDVDAWDEERDARGYRATAPEPSPIRETVEIADHGGAL